MGYKFTRGFLQEDFVLARKSSCRKLRRERRFMSKSSCEAAESIEDAVVRMARVNGLPGKTDFKSSRKFYVEWGTQNDQQGRYAGTDQTDDTEPHLYGSDRGRIYGWGRLSGRKL